MMKKTKILLIIFLSLIGAYLVYTKLNQNTQHKINSMFNGKSILKIRFLNQWPGVNIDEFSFIKEVLEEKYELIITQLDDYDIVIDGLFGRQKITNQNAIKIFYIGEAEPARLKGYDLSLGFDYLEGEPNYIRVPIYYLSFGNKVNHQYKRGPCKVDHQFFACFLVSNSVNDKKHDGIKARNHLFHRLSLYRDVKSGGRHLNNIGKVVSKNETNKWLSKCKFTIAYENCSYPGYITEKVFQAYYAGSMPIYYSHITAQNDINKNAIISAQEFKNEEDLVNYIIELDHDDQKYCDKWDQSIIDNPAMDYENIKNEVRAKLMPLLKK